ncbi:MAG TPA: hypothetical protein PK156_51305, partial [Polyangium sp.]|nr:hypothetical protein [Polyangium sp.]
MRAWATNPVFEGDVFIVLDDIRVFAKDEVRAELRVACAQVQSNGLPSEAVAALYLEEKLFGGVDGAAKRFAARADVTDVLADLVAFHDVPDLAALLADKSTPDQWDSAFSDLDANDIYPLTLGWAAGALPSSVHSDAPLVGGIRWLCRKINAEVESREAFAQAHADTPYAALFARPGTMRLHDTRQLYHLAVPLGFATRFPEYRMNTSMPAAHPLLVQLLAQRRSVMLGDDKRHNVPLQQFITQFSRVALAEFPYFEPLPEDLPQAVAKMFVDKCWPDSVREFISFFQAFDSRLAPVLIRSPMRSFGFVIGNYLAPSAIHAFGRHSYCSILLPKRFDRSAGRSLGHSLVHSLVHSLGHSLVHCFGEDVARSFIRSFMLIRHLTLDTDLLRDLQLDPDVPKWKEALDENHNVPRFLGSDALWNSIAERVLRLSLEQSPELRNVYRKLNNPLALLVVLIELRIVAPLAWILAACRELHLRFPEGDVPLEVWEATLAQRPTSAFWSALAWNEHAKLYQQNHGKLDGAHGALMLAHA